MDSMTCSLFVIYVYKNIYKVFFLTSKKSSMSNCSAIAIQTRSQIVCCNTVIYIFTYCFIVSRVQALVGEGRIHEATSRYIMKTVNLNTACRQALTGKKESKQTYFFFWLSTSAPFDFHCSVRVSWRSFSTFFFSPLLDQPLHKEVNLLKNLICHIFLHLPPTESIIPPMCPITLNPPLSLFNFDHP